MHARGRWHSLVKKIAATKESLPVMFMTYLYMASVKGTFKDRSELYGYSPVLAGPSAAPPATTAPASGPASSSTDHDIPPAAAAVATSNAPLNKVARTTPSNFKLVTMILARHCKVRLATGIQLLTVPQEEDTAIGISCE